MGNRTLRALKKGEINPDALAKRLEKEKEKATIEAAIKEDPEAYFKNVEKKCMDEITEVLKKHSCHMIPETIISGPRINTRIRFIAERKIVSPKK